MRIDGEDSLETRTMPFCENCGALLGNETKFCGSCGANATTGQPLGTVPAAPPISSASVTTSPLSVPPIVGADATGMKPNVAALLCYAGLLLFLIGLIVPIIFLLIKPHNQNRFVRFHAFQAIGVSIVGNLLYILVDRATLTVTFWGPSQHSDLSWTILVVLILADVFLISKAYTNSMFKVPGIGDIAIQLADRQAQG